MIEIEILKKKIPAKKASFMISLFLPLAKSKNKHQI